MEKSAFPFPFVCSTKIVYGGADESPKQKGSDFLGSTNFPG